MKTIVLACVALATVSSAPAMAVQAPPAAKAVLLDDLPPGCRYVLGKLICDDEPLGDPR